MKLDLRKNTIKTLKTRTGIKTGDDIWHSITCPSYECGVSDAGKGHPNAR
jgi:hypothetical protein